MVLMGSSVPGRVSRCRPAWRKCMIRTIRLVGTIELLVCQKLTPLVMSFSGYGGEIRRQSESHHSDEAGRFPSMGKGFGDHRVGQHHEDRAPGKHIDECLGGIGSMFEHHKT